MAGGGNSHASALNGAAAASALEQYNAEEHITVYAHRKKGVPITRETVQTIFGVVSALPIPIVSSIASAGLVVMDLQKGDYASATLDSLGLIPEVGSGIKEAVYGIKGLNKAVKGLETVEEARNAKRTFQEGSSFARESRAEQHEIEHEAANDNYAAANDNHAVSVEDQHPMVVNGQKGGGATRGRTVTTAKKGSGSSTGSAPRAQRGGKGGNGGGKGKPSKNKGNKNASSEAHPPKNDSPSGAGRRGSFRQAKRDYGIPVSEHPTEIRINEDKNGKIQPGRRYEFGEGEHKKSHPRRCGGTLSCCCSKHINWATF